MEVLPCSSVQYVGETDNPQQSSGTTLTYEGHSKCLEPGKQAQVLDGLVLNNEGPEVQRQGDVHGMLAELSASEGRQSGASYFDAKLEGQTSSTISHDFEDDDFSIHNWSTECDESSLANSDLIVNTIESEIPCDNQEGELSFSEPQWFGRDESMALWVKWRGKWQAGIRCARADWPLSSLKVKPTHERKKYIVIFFPHTRNYSWADMQLVCSINEFPQPIEYRSHNVGVEMVKDLTVARRFILQKLVVDMLNVIDQINTEALIETARDVMVWKEFAMEASRCNNYSDLGRMLLKLQNMISRHYINLDWLQNSFHSWAQQCQDAHSAESVELLMEELTNWILWKELKSQWDAPMQPKLGSEWKTWKQEVMKWFSTSHRISTNGDTEQQSCNGTLLSSIQISRKRPKLEIRRAEAHGSQVGTNLHPDIIINTETGFLDNQETTETATLISEPCKGDFMDGAAPTDSPSTAGDRWAEIVVEAANVEFVQTKNVELTPINEMEATQLLDPLNKNRQCIAFIESKGRQCVRLANEGDVYCCVHLASRFVGNSARGDGTPPLDTPMCGGTTTLGTKCKHRSLPGCSFCKKHRPQNIKVTLGSPENNLKRKHEENKSSTETSYCKELVLVGEVESPLQVDPLSVMDRYAIVGRNSLVEKPDHSIIDNNSTEMPHCIGSCTQDDSNPCFESPKRHSLYCEKHLPSWLKRARNGKSRIVSKEVFMDLLKECYSQEQKIHLHRACELFYRLFKSILSLRNQVPREIQLQWALSEASKNLNVGEYLMKLVCSERERLKMLWGFNTDNDTQVSSAVMEDLAIIPLALVGSHDTENTIKCKICAEEFLEDQALGTHFLDNHKKEAQWLFRGYACAICLDSFTNKKNLETHVQERHHVQFVEQCMLLQCIPCCSHFGNTEELWLHVLSFHPVDFRLSKVSEQNFRHADKDSPRKLELKNSSVEDNSESQTCSRRYICKFCGLKFDLLPDLGRHHQAAHMGPNLFSSHPPKKGIRYYAYRSKSGRLSRPRFRKGLAAASYRIRNRASENMKKRMQAAKSVSTDGINTESVLMLKASLGRLAEPQCSVVAKTLFSEIQKTKARPSNLDILSVARSTCCKVNLQALLEEKYGVLPERLYLRAAKLCGEHDIKVDWHREVFVCPKGCKSHIDQHTLAPLIPVSNGLAGNRPSHSSDPVSDEWEMDESHCIIDSYHFSQQPVRKGTILCDDISFGQESVPVACVVDESILDSFSILDNNSDGQSTGCSKPWESFTYVTKPLVDQSVGLDTKSLQLGCACPHSTCSPEICDHVYLFDNDYEDAKDVYGKPMRGRFPYDDKGRIILEFDLGMRQRHLTHIIVGPMRIMEKVKEGYLVYECNYMCSCCRTCPNRVLQNGVRVKLEVFKTEGKGWAVRAGESILRGTFVCEYIGEVLDEQEANTRRNRYGREGCNYFYKIDARINAMSRFIEEQNAYVIDATKYGNVSRFVNHSCSPNLVNHHVLVESMECQLAHIGFYASRDIAPGEELTYDYHYELLPGEGCPCHCGAPNCRGRLC